jgi:hypothetical protein
MDPKVKLLMALSVWISLCMIFVTSLEVLFVMILLGTLVMREMTDEYTTVSMKDRVNFFIYTFLFIFGLIVVRKVYLIWPA